MKKLIEKITPRTIVITDGILAVLSTILAIVNVQVAETRVPFKVLYVVCAVLWWALFAMNFKNLKKDSSK